VRRKITRKPEIIDYEDINVIELTQDSAKLSNKHANE
jgi:hypothetical protein